MADLPEKTIRRWRKGEVQPRPRSLRRLTEVLEIEPGWFYETDGDEPEAAVA